MEDVAWDNIPFTPEMEGLAKRADAVCFGSLVQRMNSRDSVLAFVRTMRPEALKVFDINLRQQYYSREILEESLMLADILKINDEEIRIVSDSHAASSQLKDLRGVVAHKVHEPVKADNACLYKISVA